MHLKDEKEERLWSVALLKLYLNLSLCDIKQCKSTLAITHCRRALELDGKNVKATFRLGQVRKYCVSVSNVCLILLNIPPFVHLLGIHAIK